jgi:hypothetical protein
MPKEIVPSSYECDCGHVSDFFENTVRGCKKKSQRKEIHLYDDGEPEHIIIFYQGEMVDIICPKQTEEDTQSK